MCRPAELAHHPCTRIGSQALSNRRVSQAKDGTIETARFPGRVQHAFPIVTDEPLQPWQRGCDDRQADGHVFEDLQW